MTEMQSLTIDPLAFRAQEQCDGTANIRWISKAVQWRRPCNASIDLAHWRVLIRTRRIMPCIAREHVGLDTSGRNRIAGNALRPAVDAKASRKALDRRLRARIQSMVWHMRDGRGDGRHEDDTAAAREILHALLRDEELAAAVDIEDAVELLLGDLELVLPDLCARVRDHKVQLSEVREPGCEELEDLVRLRHVGAQRNGFGPRAQLVDLVDQRFRERRRGGVVRDDGAAALG